MGLFISFEGMDASGKSTQIKELEKYLTEQRYNYIKTREPGGTIISEDIRNIILDIKNKCIMDDRTEALLYAAARAQLVNQLIIPSLNDNKIVLCDRYVDSSYIYQGFGRKLGLEQIKDINNFGTNGLMPDLTITFIITYDEMLRRKGLMQNEKLDRLESAGKEFFEMVYASYQKLSEMDPNRIVLIDAMRNPETIQEEVQQIITKKIKDSEEQNNISYKIKL